MNIFLTALNDGDLATAVSFYTGELLPGFTCDSLEFEEWLRMERERLHWQALEVLYQWTEQLLDGGRYQQAQTVAQRQIELEPWREKGHQQLMLALALSGERKQAELLERLTQPDHRFISLRAVFEHSWQLLSAQERRVLAQLSIFRGEFGREAALTITDTGLSELSALLSRSLLRRAYAGRYDLHGNYGQALHYGQQRLILSLVAELRDDFGSYRTINAGCGHIRAGTGLDGNDCQS